MFSATGHMQKWSVWSIVISMHQSKHASRNCANHKLTRYSLLFSHKCLLVSYTTTQANLCKCRHMLARQSCLNKPCTIILDQKDFYLGVMGLRARGYRNEVEENHKFRAILASKHILRCYSFWTTTSLNTFIEFKCK